MRTKMRNNIHTISAESNQPNVNIKEEHNKINKKRRKWLSNTKTDNGEFDIKYGNGLLTIASANVATLKKHEMVEKVTKHMGERKIDIARIQVTHFNTNEMIEINNYNIYFCHEQNQDANNIENNQNIK